MNLKTKSVPLYVTMALAMMAGNVPAEAFASEITAPTEQQQTRKIQGTVVDQTGEPIIGASVLVKATGTGAATDMNGRFTVDAAPGAVLQISYIGYITQTVKATSGPMKIVLSEDSQSLNDVIVVGYGVMKRSDLTGAVSSIDEKAIKQGVNTSIEQAMQGRIAGVQVTQNSGAPGGGISVQIRGINTLGNNEPLYVIDGVAMAGRSDDNSSVLSTLNPSDITSLEVLKDASATAIYGSRASNGVVLITTKRGNEGNPKVTYEGMMGWQSLPKHLDMMNLKQYAQFYNDRAALWGWGEREDFKDLSLLTNGTDWQDALFQTAFMHQHQLGISGGNKDMNYNLSGGYLNQEGIGIGSGFDRASFRANFETNVNKWLKIGANGYFARTRQIITFDDAAVISTALTTTPDIAIKNPDGSYGSGAESEFNYSQNPYYEAMMRDNHNKKSQLDYNLYAMIMPVKGLNLRIEYGGNFGWSDYYYFVPEHEYGSNNQKVESESRRISGTNKYKSFKQYATYDIDPVKRHHLQAMVGHEAQWGNWANLTAGRKGYISDALHSLSVGDIASATNDEQGEAWAIESYFGRLNYNVLDRYLLTATLRADGSSSFGPNNHWGWFPSAAAAWRINNEPFMQGTKDWLSNAKFRVGWGLVGNQQIGNYAYGVKMGTKLTASGTGYYAYNYANKDLKWESTKAWNLGLDLAFLNNRIEFIVDWYYKNTDNLLMDAVLPGFVISEGVKKEPTWNAGGVRNTGIEFTLNSVNIDKRDWKWRTAATLSFNRNKVTALSGGKSLTKEIPYIEGVYTITEVGSPISQFYGYNVIGMFCKEDDFYQKNKHGEFLLDANGDRIPVARPVDEKGLIDIKPNGIWVGDYIFEDVNKDGKITESDRKVIGNPLPDFTFGLNNSISYKNVEVSFFISGSVGNDVYNVLQQQKTNPSGWGNKMSFVSNYAKIAMYDKDGSLSDIKNVYVSNPGTAECWRMEPSGSNQNKNGRVSSKYVEDGSYVRLKSLSIGWNLPKRWLDKVGIEWCQLYANAQNLFTITGYDGYDPEIGSMSQNVLLQGLDNGRYPSQRIFNCGIKLNF